MSAISKAIAAFISSAVALLLALGMIEPALADTLNEGFAVAVATVIGALLSAIGVYVAPPNED